MIFEEQKSFGQSFWPEKPSRLPSYFDYDSQVSVKSSGKILKDFSTRWMGFRSPMLYFSDKLREKEFRAINLNDVYCKLFTQHIKKSKHPYKMVLKHHDVSIDLYFQERAVFDSWVSNLRDLCFMCDFTSLYNVGNCVMRGNLAMVAWAVNKQTQERYLAKMYHFVSTDPDEDDYQSKVEKQVVLNEIKALRTLEHPNIIHLKEVHELGGVLILVLEFISGHSLLKHIQSKGHLPEAEVVYIMENVLNTLKAIHEQNVVHRNLKPENILLDYTPNGTELVLTDMGFSCSIDPEDTSSWHVSRNICDKCGTPGYMAPEMLVNKVSTFKTDIFSMGVILYTCLTGEAMFRGKTVEDIIHKNIDVNFSKMSMKWNSLSKTARSLILQMTHRDPSKRPSIDEILSHEFFTATPKMDLNSTRYPMTNQLITVDSSRFRQGSEDSIDDMMSKRDRLTDRSYGDVLNSLILPPSYTGLTKVGDVLEVPAFYINTKETLKTLKELGYMDDLTEENMENEEKMYMVKNALKFQALKSSLAFLDRDPNNTPRFNLKSQKEVIAETFGTGLLDEDEDILNETEDDSIDNKEYMKCYTFPKLHDSPFRRGSTLGGPVQGGFKTQVELEERLGGITARKLPEVKAPLRKTLTNRGFLLETLKSDVGSTSEF